MAAGSRYQRLRAIAAGGMATVYLGRATGAGGFERLVAIKVMHPHLATNPEFVSMFLDEARLAARIRHPNVVATLDVDADETGVFLVMDYVEGQSLHDIIKLWHGRGEVVPLPIALRIVVDALNGLHAAHELTGDQNEPLLLVHRDVSPQNILVGVDGITRITDFGVARAESRIAPTTESGHVKGKLGYMSVEQIRSQVLDRRSDIYSAGVVAWELMTGKRLFHGDNDGAIALAAVAGAVETPRDLNDAVPAPLDNAVMRALRLRPAERWATAVDFAEALEDAAATAGIRIARAREVTDFLQTVDDERPTRMRPDAAAELAARLKRKILATPPVDLGPDPVPPRNKSRSAARAAFDDEAPTREAPTLELRSTAPPPPADPTPTPPPPSSNGSDRMVAPADKPVTSPSTVGSVLSIGPPSGHRAPAEPERRGLRASVIATVAAVAFVAAAAITYGLRIVRPASPDAPSQAAAGPPPGVTASPATDTASEGTLPTLAPVDAPSGQASTRPAADGVPATAASASAEPSAPTPTAEPSAEPASHETSTASAESKPPAAGDAPKKSKGGKAPGSTTTSPKPTGPYRPKVL